jgi:hypothetical protein
MLPIFISLQPNLNEIRHGHANGTEVKQRKEGLGGKTFSERTRERLRFMGGEHGEIGEN